MGTAAQLNVRMNPEVKAAGDSVIDLYGVSPSELIRALWEKISLGEEAFAQVVKALVATPAAGTRRTIDSELGASNVASLIRQRQASFEHELGLDPATYIPLSMEDLEDLVYEDYLEQLDERGSGHDH